MAEEYHRGEMNIAEQKNTYEGFIQASIYGFTVVGLMVLFLSMLFGTDFGWVTSLILTAIAGGALGFFLKRGTAYWLTVALLGVITVIAAFVIVGFFGS